MGSLMDYLLLAIGVYVLISGIRGKGRLFTMEHIKEGMEEKLQKTLRALYIPMGILMLFNGGSSLLKNYFYEQIGTDAATEALPAGSWVLQEGKNLGSFTFLTPKAFNIFTYVCMGLVLAGVVVLIVVMRKMTDKEAQKAAAAGGGSAAADPRQTGHSLPVSAFEFDEPEQADPHKDA